MLKSIHKYFALVSNKENSDKQKPTTGVSVAADRKFSDEIKPSSAGSDATNEEQECNLCKDKNIKNNIFCLKCKICILCCMCKETIIN